jgi:hypothetical protein
MIPMEKIFRWWDFTFENSEESSVDSYDEDTGAPDEFDIYMTSRQNPEYCLTISVSLIEWRVWGIGLGHRPVGDTGIWGVAHTDPDNPDLEELLKDWANNPEKYVKIRDDKRRTKN